jgi:hypothetical protein
MDLGVFCRQQLVALEFHSRRLFLAERNSIGGSGLLRFNVRKKRLYLQVFCRHFPLEMLQNVFLKNGVSELELPLELTRSKVQLMLSDPPTLLPPTTTNLIYDLRLQLLMQAFERQKDADVFLLEPLQPFLLGKEANRIESSSGVRLVLFLLLVPLVVFLLLIVLLRFFGRHRWHEEIGG